MSETILPVSPNWYLSSVLACASDGTAAWGGRHYITIVKKNDESKLTYSIIEKAHGTRVTTIAFSPVNEDGSYRLVSGGEDNCVKIWNIDSLSLELSNSELSNTQKVIGVDWSKPNPNLVCFVSSDGILKAWDVKFNFSEKIDLGKVVPTCMTCCPHDEHIVAVGSKVGLIFIVDVHKSIVKHKLRGHDKEIVSLSWCPVPYNVYNPDKPENSQDFLLASGAKDRFIFLWKAGTDGRYQIQIKVPTMPKEIKNYKGKGKTTPLNNTVVSWLLPNILISNSTWGELIMWNLDKNNYKNLTPSLVHTKHIRGIFAIAGVSDVLNESQEGSNSENWRSKTDIKSIWTLAQDRQVICCKISSGEPSIENIIPTQGGAVYCLAACPIDTSCIAFGAGDANIRTWHMSEPNYNKLELKLFWEQISDKVRALAWHPQKENILAFGTEVGRVGLVDTQRNTNQFRKYFRGPIRSLNWSMAPNSEESVLYVCGDGCLAYYSFNQNRVDSNLEPIPVISTPNTKFCTEISWKPDDSLLAVGYKDGCIEFLDMDLKEYGQPIHILSKTINCLAWHPASTSADSELSDMESYLAVASSDETFSVLILEILRIDDTEKNPEDQSEKKPIYRIVGTLKDGHKEKIVALAWSPHMSGYLVSASTDKVAQVWKIESQEIIATYISNFGPVYCCMWSPFSPDFIITGSGDSTLRIWSISNQKVISFPTKTRTKKKKTKNLEKETDQDESIAEDEKKSLTDKTRNEKIENNSNQGEKVLKKRKIKKVTYFPVYAEVANNNKVWCSSVQKILSDIKVENEQNILDAFDFNEIEDTVIDLKELNENFSYLMGDKNSMENSLQVEKKKLCSNGHQNAVTDMDFWKNDLQLNLLEAEKNKYLNDYLISLAPSVSIELWRHLCKSYSKQLLDEDNPHKAVSYLLCINEINEAIDAFIVKKCFKEAYVLASSRLDPSNPVIENILNEWGSSSEKDGNFKTAAECYIKLGKYLKAAKILANRKDLYSFYLAIKLANLSGDINFADSLTEKALFVAQINLNINIALSITERCPKLKFRKPEVIMYDEMKKALKETSDAKILNWLKGSSNYSILDRFNDRHPKCPIESSNLYSTLREKSELPFTGNENMNQIIICHELVLSHLSDEPQTKLEHILKACEIIFLEEKNKILSLDCRTSNLIKYLSILDGKSWDDSESLLNKIENEELFKSLSAYLCISVIQWFIKNELTEDEVIESEILLAKVLEKHLGNLLDKDSLEFWTMTNKLNELESKLSKLSLEDEIEVETDTSDTDVDEIEKIKKKREEFIVKRKSIPMTLFCFGEANKAIEKISNKEIKSNVFTFLSDVWNKNVC